MKEILKKLFDGFTYGLGLSFGIIIIVAGTYLYEQSPKESEPNKTRITFPENMTIENLEKTSAAGMLKIKGIIINNSQRDYDYLSVAALIKVGNADVGVCTYGIDNFRINQSRNFEITCETITASGLPDGIEYSYLVRPYNATYTERPNN